MDLRLREKHVFVLIFNQQNPNPLDLIFGSPEIFGTN